MTAISPTRFSCTLNSQDDKGEDKIGESELEKFLTKFLANQNSERFYCDGKERGLIGSFEKVRKEYQEEWVNHVKLITEANEGRENPKK
eukprot:Pgem_evm1s15564